MGKPACFPNFESLTKIVAKGTGEAKTQSENLEQFLGRLADRGVKVHHLAKTELSREGAKPAPLHRDLLRLYRKDQSIRLVTTNFDLLFEQAAESIYDTTPEVFHAPQLPFGDQLNGIIHIHGSISYPDQMVLTDSDFGRAYLREASVTRFLFDLYDRYTFLFVGYSHSDTVMNYLVRSLPSKTHSSHYVLIADSKDANHQHWGSLEIETIPYPQHENDHSELNEAVCKLADHVQRGMVGWHREISAIAEKQPRDLDEEEKGRIDYALKDKAMTRFFTDNASHPEWIDWLDKRGHLTQLFGNEPLQDSDRSLAWWLVARYLKNHSHWLFLLICRHRTHLHPTLWEHIARKIGSRNETSPDTKNLSQWITLLLSTAPEEGVTPDNGRVATSNDLAAIARRCITHQMIEEVLLIFDAMIRPRISIKENHYLPRGETEEDLHIRMAFQTSLEVLLVGKYKQLDELWGKGLKPNLSKIAQPLLERVIHCLQNQYIFYRTWRPDTSSLEPAIRRRTAIEPHELDEQRVRDENDVLIDAARDCMDWLASNLPGVAAQWCKRLVSSDAPLLRRLAVHSLSQRTDLTANDTIRWLLEQIDVHEYAIHHEVYQAVRHAYPEASADCRSALIEKVGSYRFPHEEHPDNEEITAREHFDWFYWLHKSDPTCPLAKQALDEVSEPYPNFDPKEPHPDLTSYVVLGGQGQPRVPSVEELLGKPPSYWGDKLLSVEGADEEGPTRTTLIQNLVEATRRDFDWSLRLAQALGGIGKWGVYPWYALINTWGQMELEEHQYLQVFTWLERLQLYPKHSREIADALYALVKNGGPSYPIRLLPRANQIAEELWKHLDRTVSIEVEHGWHYQSANYPVWGLANFWVSSVSLWRQHQNRHRQLLVKIIADL